MLTQKLQCLSEELIVPLSEVIFGAFGISSRSYSSKDPGPYRQEPYCIDKYSAEWDPLVTNNSSERHSLILDFQSFNVNTDNQSFFNMLTTVSDTYT